jgi:Outer membrane protein beta-barrel domain
MLRCKVLSAIGLVTVFCISAAAQQTVNRYDLFTGYSHLSAPSVNLGQNGFDTSFGVNLNRWLALGADFSVFTGDGSIPLSDTKIQSQAALLLPPGVVNPSIPFSANTYTFAAGPQFNIRHFRRVWFFVRPGLGVIHEHATLKGPLIAAGLGTALGISNVQTDTTYFYGAGGGVDLNTSKHVGVRVSFDYVRTPLFSNLLDTRNAFRVSVGPTWKWGEVK